MGPVNAVVLLSGGMDSAVCLAIAMKDYADVSALHVQYGQRHWREIESAERLAAYYGVRLSVVEVKLPWLKLSDSPLVNPAKDLPTGRTEEQMTGIAPTYVPGRNTILLSLAMSYAEAMGAQVVVAGPNAQDIGGYPDCRPEYYDAMQTVGQLSSKMAVEGRPIIIRTPLQRSSKMSIVAMGTGLGVPFGLTWSCYTKGPKPCGVCDTCVLRREGFKLAGVVDPLEV